ncbi:MAG TPA: endonuclease III [Thermoanaerobaculia bacterium]|jgi:endonuclease-3|nr:endonuclease III [Thermoanaerobaculia bacterium]
MASRRESAKAKRERTAEILSRLRAANPRPRIALDFRNAFELLVATVLAAQCTDERINMVTPELFRRFPTPRDLAGASLEELEELVRSTGFYRNKARAIQALAQALTAGHGGEVPPRMDDLCALPGVGRKTANVVLGNAFGLNEGVIVDTHVHRLSGRLSLSAEKDPEKIERDLMPLVPREDWTTFALLLTDHGRAVCKARKPDCAACVVADLCPSAEV